MDYRRAYVDGGCYFFTVALTNRKSDLLIQHIETLRAALRYTRERYPFKIDVIAVLPDCSFSRATPRSWITRCFCKEISFDSLRFVKAELPAFFLAMLKKLLPRRNSLQNNKGYSTP